jgi:hypothetical protein
MGAISSVRRRRAKMKAANESDAAPACSRFRLAYFTVHARKVVAQTSESAVSRVSKPAAPTSYWTPCRLGSRRYSRLGSLRYEEFIRRSHSTMKYPAWCVLRNPGSLERARDSAAFESPECSRSFHAAPCPTDARGPCPPSPPGCWSGAAGLYAISERGNWRCKCSSRCR